MSKHYRIKLNIGDWVSFVDDDQNLQIAEVLREPFDRIDPVDYFQIQYVITHKGTIRTNRVIDIQRIENREKANA